MSYPPTITREDYVREFNEAGGNKTHVEGGDFNLQLVCFGEELSEFNEAMANYLHKQTQSSREQLVKEWADVQVTLSNLAWYFGIDGQIAFNRVAQNNMTKLVGGKFVRDENGKIMKPEGYEKPDMKGL